MMKKLKTVEEVLEEIAKIKLQPPNKLTSTKYPDKVAFDCGCGERHKVNDPSNIIISVALPVKFLFECKNKYVSFVHVKGIFIQKANCLWSCTAKLYDDVIKGLKENKNI